MSIFELLMLLCFGAAWPASIYKSYISRTAKGKSLLFLVILLAGYISGIVNKRLQAPNDPVIYAYILNFIMVSADLLLFLRNKKMDSKAGEKC